jgi:uncharacterized protein involved in exopolysaccharide biosynthesis
VISLAVSFLIPKKYAGVAMILPPQQDQGVMGLMFGQAEGGLSSLAGNLLGAGTPADQIVTIMQSQRIKDAIIDRFQLMEEYNIKYRLEMYKKMDKIFDIQAGKKDGIITISAEDKKPKKAADIANAYVDELGKLMADMSMTDASTNRVFLEKRLVQARQDLTRSEDTLKAFQSKHKAINVVDQGKATIEGVALLKSQLAVQEAQLSALRSQFTDSTQDVKNVMATITNLKSQIAQLEGGGAGASAIPSVGSLPNLGQEQMRLLRDFKIQETLVELLTKQYEVAKLNESKNINAIQVIQMARIPDKKCKPKRAILVLMATFTCSFSAIIYSFLLEFHGSLSEKQKSRLRQIGSNLMSGRG